MRWFWKFWEIVDDDQVRILKIKKYLNSSFRDIFYFQIASSSHHLFSYSIHPTAQQLHSQSASNWNNIRTYQKPSRRAHKTKTYSSSIEWSSLVVFSSISSSRLLFGVLFAFWNNVEPAQLPTDWLYYYFFPSLSLLKNLTLHALWFRVLLLFGFLLWTDFLVI